MNKCITCGKVTEVGKQLHGGHFIPRGCHPTRWDCMNIWPQCSGCNTYRDGAYIEYSSWMINNHNEEYNRLLAAYNEHKTGKVKAFSMLELKVMHDIWLLRGRQLEEKLGESLFPKGWKYLELGDDDIEIEEAIARF